MNVLAFGRDVAPPGVNLGAMGFARGAPQAGERTNQKRDLISGKLCLLAAGRLGSSASKELNKDV